MNRFFLWLAMLPSGLWKSMGADTDQLRAMLKVKLMIDDRRPLTFGRQRKKKKDRKFALFFNMFLSFLMGLIYVMPLALVKDTVISLWVFYTMFMVMLTFLLITDFASVLYDTKDKLILMHRPINDRTLFLARLLHVFIYIIRVVVPMSLPGWITVGIVLGWKAAVFFPLPLFCMLFMALFFVNACYLLILRLASPQKFKEVINYFQILFAIVLFGFYYLMPRVLQSSMMQNLDLNSVKWAVYTPSYWLASLWVWVLPVTAFAGAKLLSVLALAVPVFCLWATVKWIAPHFIRSLVAIDGVDAAPQKTTSKNKTSRGSLYKKLSSVFNKTDGAKAGFIITWLQTSRSRTFRMRVFPSFAYVPIYFVYLLTLDSHSISLVRLSEGSKHIWLLYLCSFVMIQSLNYLTISDQYKAAWVYYSAPLEKPGNVMIGAFKAILIKYFLPFFGAVSIFVIAVWGPAAILDVILAFTNVTLFAACIMRVGFKRLPFSVMDQMQTGGNRTVRVLVSLVIPSSLGFGHYLALHLWWLKLLFLGLSAILLWLVADSYANTDWANMRKEEL